MSCEDPVVFVLVSVNLHQDSVVREGVKKTIKRGWGVNPMLAAIFFFL